MTKNELDYIGGMNMCDEISNEAYKKIMCHCEEEPINEILDKIRAEIKAMSGDIETIADVLVIIDKYKAEREDKE